MRRKATTERHGARSLFWMIYGGVLLFLTLLVVIAILVTQSHLSDYENARPVHEAQRVFETYYGSRDYEALYETAKPVLSPAEGKAEFSRYLTEKSSSGELSFVCVGAETGENVKYNVRSGDNTFSAFTLKQSGERSRYGQPLYALSEVEVPLKALYSARVEVPGGSTVSVNGYALGADYCKESGIETESCRHMPEGVQGITYDRYEIAGLLFEPTVTATDKNGSALTLSLDEEKGSYVTALTYDSALQEEYGDYVLEAAQTYACAMQEDASIYKALSYLVPKTQLYHQTANITLFTAQHTGYRFEDVSVSEFYRYDENTFSCRVSFVHVLTGGVNRFGGTENREKVDITWYYRRSGSRFLIYDRFNNN